MRLLMCKPRHDELVSSAWARSALRTTIQLHMLMSELIGGRFHNLRFFSCAHLRVLAECFAMPARRLLRDHTVFPFFTASQPSSEIAKLEAKVLAEATTKEKSVTFEHIGPKLWCSKCTKKDVARYGDSHWRVSHNLPGVSVCTIHRVSLVFKRDWADEVGRSFDSILPHEIAEPVPVVKMATPYLLKLAEAATRLQRRPQEEFIARGTGWTKARLETLGFDLTEKRRFNAELIAAMQSCLGPAAEEVLGSHFEHSLRQVARIPYLPGAAPHRRHLVRHLALQAFLELDAGVVAKNLPKDLVVRARTKYGLSVFDAAQASAAKEFIDNRIKIGKATTAAQVLDHCGKKNYNNMSAYPLLRVQIDRLLNSKAARRRPNKLTDKERAEIARRFIEERVKTGTPTAVRDVIAACGMQAGSVMTSFPLLRQEIERLRDLSIAKIKHPSVRDPQLASVARAFVDSRLATGTRTYGFEVLEACGVGYPELTLFPMLAAEYKRFRALPISTRKPPGPSSASQRSRLASRA